MRGYSTLIRRSEAAFKLGYSALPEQLQKFIAKCNKAMLLDIILSDRKIILQFKLKRHNVRYKKCVPAILCATKNGRLRCRITREPATTGTYGLEPLGEYGYITLGEYKAAKQFDSALEEVLARD